MSENISEIPNWLDAGGFVVSADDTGEE